MWHEARRVEKQLRGMMVNFKKRAERRRAFYNRMKQDPVQLLRLYGHKCKIHIDPQVATAAEQRSVMMPWQGHADNMIDRFDGRAHLDIINEKSSEEEIAGPLLETDPEQNRLNYERYRTLVMIDHSGATEEEYLQQLEVEEMFPKKDENKDKKEKSRSAAKASIGYTYEDSPAPSGATEEGDSDDSDSDDESILSDIDVTVDVDDLTKQEIKDIDSLAMNYGMAPAQYCRKLKVDKVEAEEQKRIREQEEERALMGGRRSRKHRRSMRDRQQNQPVQNSPPSYARRSSPTYEPYRSRSSSSSSSRSCSPENSGQVQFITEFGSSTTESPTKPDPSGDSLANTSSSRRKDHKEQKHDRRSRRSRDRGRSRRSRSRDRRRSRSRSRSRDRRDRSRSSSRERSRSRDRHRRRSRSPSRSRSYRDEREGRDRDRERYREQGRENRESERAKDTAKASAKLTGMSKAKQSTDPKDKTKLTPQERMKKRMQMMLNKQLKCDRKEERIKRDAKEQERLDREDDLRQMQRKWKEKNRRSPSPRSWSSHRRSRSRSPDRSRRRSDSPPSPPRKVPVVDFEEETRGEEVIHYVYENN